MDYPIEDIQRDRDRKKEKKKKHDRSHSGDKKKKKEKGHKELGQRWEREGSREHKKKDKEKKHHRDRERSRSKGHKEREYDKAKSIEPQRLKERQSEKEKPRERQPEREKHRDERSRERSKQRKHKQHKQHRSKSHKRKHSKDRDRHRRDYHKEDKYEKWRRERDQRFRFDSPPKSDESDISDDPEKMDKLNKMKAQKELVSSKADRKLYLGNLPPNITSNQLMQMLNAALKKMQINIDSDGDSIISAWVSPDGVGHYAFVQFRSALEATAGLALNGASLYGYQLKLGRPKQYIEYQKQLLNQFGSDSNIDTIIAKFAAMGGFTPEALTVEDKLVHPPSKVIILKHIVTIEELAIDEEYKEITEDVMQMAKRYGDVQKLVIPRPLEIDLEVVQKRVKGLGYIFIKYARVDQAKYARKQFIKQMFSDRSVACSYFSEDRFEKGELDPIEKVVIDF